MLIWIMCCVQMYQNTNVDIIKYYTHNCVTNLKIPQLYLYYMKCVQDLLPRNFPLRVDLCIWLRYRLITTPDFYEASFYRNSINNFQNNHTLAENNHNSIIWNHFQEQLFLNNFCYRIIDDHLTTPCIHSQRLLGEEQKVPENLRVDL